MHNAGRVIRGRQVMHNGILVHLGSYYGPEIAHLLAANHGVHEPQEERVFQLTLPLLPRRATMVELGSFWAFYSMWFALEVRDARNFMIEPDLFSLESGRRNFALNHLRGHFTHAAIGRTSSKGTSPPTTNVDDFARERGISFIDLLHSDIQGAELEMLEGAAHMLDGRTGYVFLSTHTEQLHTDCRAHLLGLGYRLISDASPAESFSEDGLLVVVSPDYPRQLDPVNISRRGVG